MEIKRVKHTNDFNEKGSTHCSDCPFCNKRNIVILLPGGVIADEVSTRCKHWHAIFDDQTLFKG